VTTQVLAAINDSFGVIIVASAVLYGTPLLFAALGELLAERSGVLNLGVEGMMLVGAVMGFWSVQRLDAAREVSLAGALLVAALAGAAIALVHAFLVITLRANQIVSGLALTIFAGAAGLSSYLGNDLSLSGSPADSSFTGLDVAGLEDLPVVGPIVFDQSALVYLSWALVLGIGLYLARTRPGLNVRAVGEAPASADAMGIDVTAYRYAHTLAGGALAGVGGACFSLQLTPQWVSGLTGGAGWIAVALVIFAFWRADLCLVGAYLFGGLSALPLTLQARGWLTDVPSEVFSSLPYVMTVVVLVAVASGAARRRLGAPAALGTPYVREER
jgi:general nucleoside transport system permease protein